MHLIILYEELAWYFVNCINILAKNHHVHILVICRQPNAVAPFQFEYIHPNIKIMHREQMTDDVLLEECKKFKPSLIYAGGWSHSPYISLLKKLKPKSSVIGFDNQWSGSLKQRLGAVYFRLFLKPLFKFAFVPGSRQHLFAQKLGFKSTSIMHGAYCCDYDFFSATYQFNKAAKKENFPKRFLFAGRYTRDKGVDILWEVFIELQKEHPNDWELWCLGKGDLSPISHEKIKHFGFIQGNAAADIIKNTGVFILPSLFEPWGVVVHEYACAGFPLICSDKVGAITAFLEEGANGFIVKAGDKALLKQKMKDMMNMPREKLNLMSEKSVELASKITPETWARNLMKSSL